MECAYGYQAQPSQYRGAIATRQLPPPPQPLLQNLAQILVEVHAINSEDEQQYADYELPDEPK